MYFHHNSEPPSQMLGKFDEVHMNYQHVALLCKADGEIRTLLVILFSGVDSV